MYKNRLLMIMGVIILTMAIVGGALAQDETQKGNPEGITVSSPATELIVPESPAHPEAVLWDQPLSSVNQNAYVNQDFSDVPTYSSYLADNFENSSAWQISTIFIPGNGWNGFTSLLNASGLTWQIYEDNAGIPAGDPSGGGNPPVWTLTLPPTDPQVTLTNGSGGYLSNTQLDLTTPIDLPAGQYWFIFYPSLPFTGGGQFGRQPSDTTNGSMGYFINPGGGFGLGTDWQPWTIITAPPTDIAFRLEGNIAAPNPYYGDSEKLAPVTIVMNEPIEYTIIIQNTGLEPGLDTTMTDPIPLGVNYNDDVVCTAGECSYDEATDTILWNGEVEAGDFVEVTFSVTPNTGLCGASIVNEATITDPEAPGPVTVSASTFVSGPTVLFEDFEADDGGYESEGPNPWTWGPPPAGLAPAHSGVNVWATQSPYVNNAIYELESAPIDLSAVNPDRPLLLQWWQKLDVEVSFDYAYVDISNDDGATWTNLYEGNYHGSWEQMSVDISSFVGDTILLRFELETDVSVVYAGWAIDDVTIISGCLPPDITLEPTSLFEELLPDQQATQELFVCNDGEATLNWNITEVDGLKYIGENVTVYVPATDANVGVASRNSVQSFPARNFNIQVDWISMVDIDVLIITPDVVGGGDISLLLSTLAAYPDLIVTVWDGTAGTPTVADMLSYDVVFVGNDILWSSSAIDKTVLSNNLADYVDAGGKILAGSFIWSYDDWGLGGGRFLTEDYSPFEMATQDFWVNASLGTFDPDHPIMSGITAVTDFVNHQDTALSSTGEWVASWDDGENFVAVSPGVVGLNQLYFHTADFGDQVGDLLHNAFLYLSVPPFDAPWVSEDPLNGEVLAGECNVVDVTFDSTGLEFGIYSAGLEIKSNDPDESPTVVPVELKVGEPDIVVPSSLEMAINPNDTGTITFTIGNTGTIDLDWSAVVTGTWLTLDPTSGTVNEGEVGVVDAIFDSTGLAPGVYEGTITITSNDPDDSPSVIDVTLTVNPYEFFIPFIHK